MGMMRWQHAHCILYHISPVIKSRQEMLTKWSGSILSPCCLIVFMESFAWIWCLLWKVRVATLLCSRFSSNFISAISLKALPISKCTVLYASKSLVLSISSKTGLKRLVLCLWSIHFWCLSGIKSANHLQTKKKKKIQLDFDPIILSGFRICSCCHA